MRIGGFATQLHAAAPVLRELARAGTRTRWATDRGSTQLDRPAPGGSLVLPTSRARLCKSALPPRSVAWAFGTRRGECAGPVERCGHHRRPTRRHRRRRRVHQRQPTPLHPIAIRRCVATAAARPAYPRPESPAPPMPGPPRPHTPPGPELSPLAVWQVDPRRRRATTRWRLRAITRPGSLHASSVAAPSPARGRTPNWSTRAVWKRGRLRLCGLAGSTIHRMRPSLT